MLHNFFNSDIKKDSHKKKITLFWNEYFFILKAWMGARLGLSKWPKVLTCRAWVV